MAVHPSPVTASAALPRAAAGALTWLTGLLLLALLSVLLVPGTRRACRPAS